MGSREKDRDKGVNVQVLLRCRPFSEEELRSNIPQVISCFDHRREVTVCQNIACKQIDRTFTFDKVFGPQSQQKDLYEQAVVPIVHEVLDGFNCTIFAYGQTGTGKTFTMEGTGRRPKQGGLPAEAGVIPRAVQQIFDTLESQNAEYSVKVTFLELYNEEITDLLAPEEFSKVVDDKQRKPLVLMEDGKGGVLVRGLEEEMVTSASEIYSLLDRGSSKRRTAETYLNKQSSRSHSIFSITIHIKEATPEGEELIKCGKLNLVDLAGSENISRSGAREGRAREAGEINKSLLTLGRVITALVEHLAHVPYRDSKLTRLLRDSLGGKTKTCIIATVSPSVHCLEETLCTLDYAHRAKNIRNKPEVNQKMMKSALIKDLYGEIERLKIEVYAAREKNGIYLPRERFLQDVAEKKDMSERIEAMEFDIQAKDKQIEELQDQCESQRQYCVDLKTHLEDTQKLLQQSQESLLEARDGIKQAHCTLEEHKYVISAQRDAETGLFGQTTELRSDLESVVNDITRLFATLDRKNNVQAGNNQVVESFQRLMGKQLHVLRQNMMGSVVAQRDLLQNMEHDLLSFLATEQKSSENVRRKLNVLRSTYLTHAQNLRDVIVAHESVSTSTLTKLNSTFSAHGCSLDQLLLNHVADGVVNLGELQNSLSHQQCQIGEFAQLQCEAVRQSMNTMRNMSSDLLDSLSKLHTSAIDFSKALDTRRLIHDSSLLQLAEAYKEQAEHEESQLLESITEIVALSMSRKLKLVQSRVCDLRRNSMSEAAEMKLGLIGFQEIASSTQDQLKSFLMSSESDSLKASSILAAKHGQMGKLLHSCAEHTERAKDRWKTIRDSLQQFGRNHIPLVVSMVTEGLDSNRVFDAQFKALHTAFESHVIMETDETTELIDGALQLEQDAARGLQSIVETQSHVVSELERSHDDKLRELQQIAERKFSRDYQEDHCTGSTPPRRIVNIPSLDMINLLRAPTIECLQLECRSKSTLPELDGQSRQTPDKVSNALDLTFRDSRPPLATLN